MDGAGGAEDARAEDAELVARARADRAVFAPLYRRHVGPVYRYCAARLGSREAAEDATSLVFARALAALPSCRPESFRPWLFQIAHNVVTDQHRRGRPEAPLEAAAGVPAALPNPEEAALAAEAAREVADLLARLPADQRRVTELRLAGLTGAEIAEVLGRSHAAVRMLQSRAAARLRRLRAETARGGKGNDRADI